MPSKSNPKYRWATPGDLNAFFALFLDNIVNLFILAAILTGFGIPKEFIYTKMIPGTAMGVMFGDLAYTWLAFRLVRKTGRTDITAMPLGLDLPSTVGIAVAVMGPAFLVLRQELGDVSQAAYLTWYVGIGTTLWMAVIKICGVFLGPVIQRVVPAAGLVGSIAGVGLVWLGAEGLTGVYEISFVGLLSLAIIIYTLIAHFDFPLKIPGAAAAVIFGTLFYYLMAAFGILDQIGIAISPPGLEGIGFLPPLPQGEGLRAMFGRALPFLPLAIPFGILVLNVGINITEAARLVGDTYHTRSILLTDAVATIIAGLCGGVAQSTPYFGHSAYKKMGAHAAYTLCTGLAVGLGGIFGLIGFLVDLIPGAVVKPILILIGFDMVRLAFRMTPRRHVMAVAFAIAPSVLNYAYTQLKTLLGFIKFNVQPIKHELRILSEEGLLKGPALLHRMEGLIPAHWLDKYVILGALSQGFILTAMIWGALVAFVVDRKIVPAAFTMLIAATLTFFGLIHSVYPNGQLYLPWHLAITSENGLRERSLTIPYEFAGAYLLVAIALLGMYYLGSGRLGKGPSEKQES